MRNDIEIKPLTEDITAKFLFYLGDHISDNGKDNSPLFLPISKNDLSIPEALSSSFRDGQSISIDKLGWRRVFIAMNKKNEIIGHIDLKSHNQSYTSHRAVLGMGVHRDYRQMGLGCLLIESIISWVKDKTSIEQIDLWVLTENKPAIQLYNKLGFQKTGEVEDMFRIDGVSLNYKMMTKKIEKDRHGQF